MTNGAFIYLFGFAGSGKLTIAKEIAERWDCIVVDNHHVNNVIFALIDIDQHGQGNLPDAMWDHIIRVRHAAMDAIRDLAKPGRNFVFTNELIEGVDRHHVWFLEIAELAHDRGALFLPVRLLVDADELARRITSPEREEKLKLTNPDIAVEKAANEEVFRPEGYDYLELDVTHLEPAESAARILAELERRTNNTNTNREKGK
jgi:predicted kinase